MQEVWGPSSRLGGLRVSQFPLSFCLCPFVTPCVDRSAGHSVRTDKINSKSLEGYVPCKQFNPDHKGFLRVTNNKYTHACVHTRICNGMRDWAVLWIRRVFHPDKKHYCAWLYANAPLSLHKVPVVFHI